ncbi:Anaphase-promoting complex subunit [Thalictrum thalictroides]|uniref:Anaphase-promoting complex subunit 4 n=1 Tax=Thalictrum thalictroides TaxID=46969 RepID=A0A7J6WX36_THATH|nr:Anaphase-promoting complex subunit [Thalictrum thalictroides]
MDTDEPQGTSIPFQLQFDKPVSAQIKIAEWNPEKDLLAMVTEDSKILLHRFNWQRLWTISPGRCIMSLCWRPDGKAIAVGLDDGTISLHDVEIIKDKEEGRGMDWRINRLNGKLLRSIKSHNVAVVCLNWEEDCQPFADKNSKMSSYEDRTSRFFPSAPKVLTMSGLVSGDDNEESFHELSNSSHQRFNILTSGDKDGSICFSIFGIFLIGKVNIHESSFRVTPLDRHGTFQLANASIYKVALSKDLCHLIVMSFGELVTDNIEDHEGHKSRHESLSGLHCVVLDTSIFQKRKNELHQVAQQASNIEDLIEVVRSSISVMSKQWSDAMHVFHEKFDMLSPLISDHGLDSCPQEEFLSLLGGARTSPPIHQFLVNSLGEAGLKRVSKAVDNAGKELHLIIREHLQPATEIIGFRIGELRGLSRWRARYEGIGLDENLINSATEKAGMLLIQVERFIHVLATVLCQFQNFFTWLSKSIKLLMSEPSDQLLPYNSELVITFLKFLYDKDPIKHLLEVSEVEYRVEVDLDTEQRLQDLVQFGGFSDTEFLRRTLAKEFEQLEYSFKEAFLVPFTTISKKIRCEDVIPLFPIQSSSVPSSLSVPTSISYYKDVLPDVSNCQPSPQCLVDYICFRIPGESFPDMPNSIGIARGFLRNINNAGKDYSSVEAVLLTVPEGYHCVDLSLYKETQIVLLLNAKAATSDNVGNAQMMILQASELPFVPMTRSAHSSYWNFHELKDSALGLQIENEKVRCISHSVHAPLAVSASRGVACVFAARKRALVYILEEDEDEVSDVE